LKLTTNNGQQPTVKATAYNSTNLQPACPVAPEDGTGVKFVIATACPVPPEDGTGAKRI